MQLDLFSSVMHAYANSSSGELLNSQLYSQVGLDLRMSADELGARVPVGSSGANHNLFHRKVRWYQQTLKQAGILERIDQGVWGLTNRAGKDLNQIQNGVAVIGFSTDLGVALLGSCDHVFSRIDSPIVLALTSPPYPLRHARSYGNVDETQYIDWLCKMLEPLVANLAYGGSICLNLSNDIFLPKSPARSMVNERLLIALNSRFDLQLLDRMVWSNPSKPPGPIQYASLQRNQLNTGYEPIYWLSRNPEAVSADNRRVLQEHTEKHLKLIHGGGEHREVVNSDGAYRIRRGSYSNPTKGRIPRNVLTYGHSCGDQRAYKASARQKGLPAHGAPMPLKLAEFLIQFLSKPGDLVVDPFGGSHTTAVAAQRLGRRWLTTEVMAEYVLGSASRFEAADGFNLWLPDRLAA